MIHLIRTPGNFLSLIRQNWYSPFSGSELHAFPGLPRFADRHLFTWIDTGQPSGTFQCRPAGIFPADPVQQGRFYPGCRCGFCQPVLLCAWCSPPLGRPSQVCAGLSGRFTAAAALLLPRRSSDRFLNNWFLKAISLWLNQLRQFENGVASFSRKPKAPRIGLNAGSMAALRLAAKRVTPFYELAKLI